MVPLLDAVPPLSVYAPVSVYVWVLLPPDPLPPEPLPPGAPDGGLPPATALPFPVELVERLDATVAVAVSVRDRSPSTTTPRTAAPTTAAVLINVIGRFMNARNPLASRPSSGTCSSDSLNWVSEFMSESMRCRDQSPVTRQ